ncbi:histidine phosphatase family protein [Candidatus Uabimicrobium sp. HlEnr_7]|uniref:histidine phosphatase family protein n=1 Tax=Candidatus Uabimicrobium helgolandensis TaxID=3095367 RepID=UPI0035563D41
MKNLQKIAFFCAIIMFISMFLHFRSSMKVMQTIIVVRHAQAYKNLSQPPLGIDKDSLTELGKKQANSLGKILCDRNIDLWISSTKNRAIETRDLVFLGNKYSGKKETIVDFLSMNKGNKDWPWRIQNWKRGEDPRPENGESLLDATNRSIKKIQQYSSQKTIIIFSHGDICATLIGHAMKTPIWKRYERHQLPLAGYAEIEILGSGEWRLK